MSFSSEVKQELSKIGNFKNDMLKPELMGYFLSGNMLENADNFQFITENEFNIEHLYKILFHLKIEYEPDRKGKCYVAQIQKKVMLDLFKEEIEKDSRKFIAKGAFLGAGSVNNPEKNYHLEICFYHKKKSEFVAKICEEYGIYFKEIKIQDKYQLYLKEAEEISRFLALIGANRAVLKWEDVRVMKQMKNSVNRKVNCETANLNKTVEAAIRQIEDIKLLQKMKRFEELPKELKQVAKVRLENPDLSLKDLSQLMEPKIRKIRN